MAYSALTTLLQTLDQFSTPNRYFVLEKNHQLQSFIENLKFLQEFLQNSPSIRNDQARMKSLEGKIRDAAYRAQDLIENFVSQNQSERNQLGIIIRILDQLSDMHTYAHRYFAFEWFSQLHGSLRNFNKTLKLLTKLQEYLVRRGLSRLVSPHERLAFIDDLTQSTLGSTTKSKITDMRSLGSIVRLITTKSESKSRIGDVAKMKAYKTKSYIRKLINCIQNRGTPQCIPQPLDLINCIKAEMINRSEHISRIGLQIILDTYIQRSRRRELGLLSLLEDAVAERLLDSRERHPSKKGFLLPNRPLVSELTENLDSLLQSQSRKDIFNEEHSTYLALRQVLDEIDFIKVKVAKIDEKISTKCFTVEDSAKNRSTTIKNYEQKIATKDDNSSEAEYAPISCPEEKGPALSEEVHSTVIYQDNNKQGINKSKELVPFGLFRKNMQNNAVVGLDTDIHKIKEQLMGEREYLQCVTIVGMGGIGKTTLAKVVFDDPYIRYHFYIRAWITVSQVYEFKDLLLGLLKAVAPCLDHDTLSMNKDQLREKLYRCLKGQRFLIVMDDMWKCEAWDYIRRCFPDDKNGSRVLLTTRLNMLAEQVSPNRLPHEMSLLNKELSWELLHSRLLIEGTCPPELVDIGKKIAEKCKGLPLAIVVVAGILSNVSETCDCWEEVAGGMKSLLTSYSEQCLRILAMSYNYLPHHLRACFLYLCGFPEDCEIECWRLIRMWMAEGFVEPKCCASLEAIAEGYLEDLVNRSLVMVRKRGFNGKIETCFIHDLVRDLSFREARKENFMHVMTKQVHISSDGIGTLRRISFHSGSSVNTQFRTSIGNTRSFLFFEEGFEISWNARWLSEFKLLRVLDIGSVKFDIFPHDILRLTHLRFLAATISGELPSAIYELWNLQTLVVHDSSANKMFNRYFSMTFGIWLMSHLRHLNLGAVICLPCPSTVQNNSLVLENLQSLSRIRLTSCTEQAFKRLPNLKKLAVHQTKEDLNTSNGSSSFLNNLAQLRQLETLKCSFFFSPSQTLRLPDWKAFPERLKNLSINWSNLPWEHMETLGMLPNLEVLKLKNYAFQGPTWEPNEGGFQSLKVLLIENTDLVHWIASKYNFPRLQYLILRCCEVLEEIPHDLADDLLLLELHYCSSSAESSAREIEEEQRNSDNNDLVVRIRSRSENFVPHPPADESSSTLDAQKMVLGWDIIKDTFKKIWLQFSSQNKASQFTDN